MKAPISDPRLGVPRCRAKAMTRPAITVAMLMLLGAAPASAQVSVPAPALTDSLTVAPSLRYAVGNAGWVLASGSWGRARLRAPRVVGAAVGFEEVRPEVGGAAADVPNPLPLARIDVLQVPVGASRTGAIVGGVLGAALGIAMASALGSMDVLGPAEGPSGGDLLTGALMGGVPGACLGALVGTAFTRWKTIYPAP